MSPRYTTCTMAYKHRASIEVLCSICHMTQAQTWTSDPQLHSFSEGATWIQEAFQETHWKAYDRNGQGLVRSEETTFNGAQLEAILAGPSLAKTSLGGLWLHRKSEVVCNPQVFRVPRPTPLIPGVLRINEYCHQNAHYDQYCDQDDSEEVAEEAERPKHMNNNNGRKGHEQGQKGRQGR